MAGAGVGGEIILVCLCLLAAAASGLEIPHYAYTPSTPTRQFGYPPGEVVIIDLGNTNSCIAGYGNPDEAMFQFCVPSWVAFTNAGATLVGDAARVHAEIDPENAIFGLKRLLGLRRNRVFDEDTIQGFIDRVPYTVGTRDIGYPTIQVNAVDKQLGIEKIVSMVIAQLKRKAEHHLGRTVEHAVLTVPMHFHLAATSAAVYAAKLARLKIFDDTVFEPVAAAVAHGLHRKLREDGNALVLHVGGGTADASIVALWDGSLEVTGYHDDLFLGGDDFDQRIVDYFVEMVMAKHGKDISGDKVALAKLRTACEIAKKALSSQDRVQVTVESLFDGMNFSEPLLRSEFEELNDELFRKVIALIDKAMVEPELEKSMIDEIVLVGGSTMIPKIQKLVKEYFDGKEPSIRVKPDEAIALGAALVILKPCSV